VRLSPHFTLREAQRSQYATRHGIDNLVPPMLVGAVTMVAENILEPVRAAFGGRPISPSSWYRCEQLNKAIGGSGNSQHVIGQAVDFEIPGIPNRTVAQWIMETISFDQLILEYWRDGEDNAGWVHCSYHIPERNRREVVTLTKQDGYRSGLP
jgi:zinc D-Ala-D-Ala carboxypeptidase